MKQVAAKDSVGKRYRILGTLGQGGMGTVLLARDRLGGLVALKRLAPAVEQWQGAMRAVAKPDAPTPHLADTGGAVQTFALPRAQQLRVEMPTIASITVPRAGVKGAVIATASTMWQAADLAVDLAVDPDRGTVQLPTSAVRTATCAPVAPVAPSGPALQDSGLADMLRLTLAREFRMLSSLRHPNIISVLDYGFDDELLPYFTMELLEGAQTILQAGRDRPLATQVDLLAQMLQALAYLHRRGVIHRDLKPGNVMVVDGRVKVLDFGVSILREREVQDGRLIVGTLAYMAPELIGGAPATEASDLYAVGVIAYELFSGRYPFSMHSVTALREAILRGNPDVRDLHPKVAPVVASLLAKRPEQRPISVDDVLASLSARTGQPLSVETAATRESFLQAAELVGRDAELSQLSGMLEASLAARGSAALVGGESGVGKSRLLDELRARALVEGVVVLRGQTVREGGPYHAFRDVLRGLLIRVEPDDHEASVLEAVVPDVAALLGREVPARAAIDPEAAQARLVAVVEALLRRHREPTLIVVEDLQWAGSESLKLLTEVAGLAPELPLLVVGTYRDDERPRLPADLPGMRVLKLRRLGAEGIAALAASMLGDAGRRPEVIARLARETEGNPFFLVEVVRALAEDAGALSRVGREPMPETLTSGGLHAIVKRRLDQVPRRARPLLEAAAAVGRRIDPAILRRLSPETDVDAWLDTCANTAVLEADEKSYRFAHDKLREGLIAALSPDAARALNRRIAEAIEAEYPGSTEHTAALTKHWAAAGDAVKEAHHAALAGEQALQSSAYLEAIAYFERAAALIAESAPSPPEGPRDRLLRTLAAVLPLGRAPVAAGSDRFRLGMLEGRLSEAYGRLSNHAESFRRGRRALAHLGRPMPDSTAGLLLGLPVQAALRAAMTALPERFLEASPDGQALLLEATRIQTRVTEACFYTQESLPMMWSGLSVLNLGEPAGPSAVLACGYAIMAAVAGVIPLHPMAEAWSRRALSLADGVGTPYDVAFVLQRVSSYRLWMGEWKVAEEGFAREVRIAREVGDQRLLSDAMLCTVLAATFQGQFRRVVELLRDLDVWARQTDDAQILCGGRIAQANANLRLGDVAEAVKLCEEARPLADASAAVHDDIRCYGVLALAAHRAGQDELAREALDRVLPVIQATRPVAYWTQDGIAAAADAALLRLEDAQRSPPSARGAAEQAALSAVRGVEAFAKIFPIGKPFALLSRGTLDHLMGRVERATRAWERCLAEAARLGTPYEEGRAHLELGRHLPPRHPERRGHLMRAVAVFTDLGTTPDLARAEAALASP